MERSGYHLIAVAVGEACSVIRIGHCSRALLGHSPITGLLAKQGGQQVTRPPIQHPARHASSAVPASFKGTILNLPAQVCDQVRFLIRDVVTLVGIRVQVIQFRLAVPVENQLVRVCTE